MQFRIAGGDVEEIATLHAQAPAVEVGDGANAVPFEFEAVGFWIRRKRGEDGEHRLDALWHRRGRPPAGKNLSGSFGHCSSSRIVLRDHFPDVSTTKTRGKGRNSLITAKWV